MHSPCSSFSCPVELLESINLEMEVCYVLANAHEEKLSYGSVIRANYK